VVFRSVTDIVKHDDRDDRRAHLLFAHQQAES
jgi:hypothetical protein